MRKLVVVARILVILAIAIPAYRQAHLRARETAVKRAIQVIHAAQFQFQTQEGRFAVDLAELGAWKALPSDLAGGRTDGYEFSLIATERGYAISASPVEFGVTGSHTLYSDESLVLHKK